MTAAARRGKGSRKFVGIGWLVSWTTDKGDCANFMYDIVEMARVVRGVRNDGWEPRFTKLYREVTYEPVKSPRRSGGGKSNGK